MLEEIQRQIAVGGAHAAARMVKLVQAAKSEHVQFDAARFLLGVAGVKPVSEPNVNVNIAQAAGYVILLGEPGKPEMRIIGGEQAALPAAEQMKIAGPDSAVGEAKR